MTDDECSRLYVDFYDRIVGYLVRKYGFTDDQARDIAQDVFFGVFRTVEEMPFAPWSYLKTAAHNRAANVIRTNVTHRKSEGGSLDAMPHLSESAQQDLWTSRPPASPEDMAAEKEELHQLGERIEALSESLRSCVLLRMQGRSYEEIATVLHITIDAVRTRLRDAKRQLRPGGRR
jgi:RNA polymerase sigma-70 factor (ECF subfamily)